LRRSSIEATTAAVTIEATTAAVIIEATTAAVITRKRQNMANSFAVPATDSQPSRLLLTRAETLAALRIGETTLHWLARTKKLNAIKIGARVLFSAAEVERLARRGCSLTGAEKRAATRQPDGMEKIVGKHEE
jgi:hypothetical protein